MIQELDRIYDEMSATADKKYFDLSDPDPIVYHYTNAEALLSIVSGSSFQASNVLFMNDPNELDYSISLAHSTIQDMRHDASGQLNQLFLDYYDDYFDAKLKPRAARQFVLSFSLNGDSLHLWNMYAKNDGYAIGFRLKRLVDALLTSDGNDNNTKIIRLRDRDGEYSYDDYSLYFGLVLYARRKQKQFIVEAVDYIDKALRIIGARVAVNESDASLGEMSKFIQFLVSALYNMKYEPHRVEEEYRITLIPDTSFQGVAHKARSGIITPYIELGHINSTIDSIIIGPKMKDEAASKGLDCLLNLSGLSNVKVLNSSIKLR